MKTSLPSHTTQEDATMRKELLRMNPFEAKPIRLESLFLDWNGMYPKPYDKHTVDPYTRTRVILMNGTEFEAN